VRSRLHRIEDSGLVRICAQIDPIIAGTVGAWAFVGVTAAPGRTRVVAEHLAAVAEVLVVELAIGPHDILIFLAAPDRTRMTEIIADEIRSIRGVLSTETWDVAINVRAHSGFGRNL
jgi:Lrp/AsnC family transcriptional regulator for asnA, asnC and gidA